MRPVTLTCTSQVGAANNISLSQTPGGPGNLTITGSLASAGVATLPTPNYIRIVTVANETARTFTITGTDANGNVQVEAIKGANNGTTNTTHRFKTVTQIAVDAATAGAITAGSAAFALSEPCPMDYRPDPVNIGLFFSTTANTDTFKVQFSGDDPWSFQSADDWNANGTWFDHASLTAMTAAANGSQTTPVRGMRLNSNEAGAAVVGTLKIVQAGL